ncbi:hypothetical protein I4U23_015998 [Adineta vaga]|nr:hypothetical protein I4U23_015998 [Adineta vaga]
MDCKLVEVSRTDPEFIRIEIRMDNGEYGFDMTFSIHGMWENGLYFAKNAFYSCPSDTNLRRPPKKSESASGLRYNSVSGDTGGSKVYIIYGNRVAYPTYLITFTP